jgi:hypothetical protein
MDPRRAFADGYRQCLLDMEQDLGRLAKESPSLRRALAARRATLERMEDERVRGDA